MLFVHLFTSRRPSYLKNPQINCVGLADNSGLRLIVTHVTGFVVICSVCKGK